MNRFSQRHGDCSRRRQLHHFPNFTEVSVSKTIHPTRSHKATRRSPNTWVDNHPDFYPTPRPSLRPEKPDVIRFPDTGPVAARREDGVAHRLTGVRATWSARERELRRLQAIRKQEELLLLLADAELEDGMRMAVADGELPVLPPELDVLRN
jgi:hypothetical protein